MGLQLLLLSWVQMPYDRSHLAMSAQTRLHWIEPATQQRLPTLSGSIFTHASYMRTRHAVFAHAGYIHTCHVDLSRTTFAQHACTNSARLVYAHVLCGAHASGYGSSCVHMCACTLTSHLFCSVGSQDSMPHPELHLQCIVWTPGTHFDKAQLTHEMHMRNSSSSCQVRRFFTTPRLCMLLHR